MCRWPIWQNYKFSIDSYLPQMMATIVAKTKYLIFFLFLAV